MQIENWLNTKLQQDIWKKKYRNEDETLNDFFDRVSNKNPIVKELIVNKKFIPAGRILANRGLHKKGKKITYSNCYVLSSPEDNIESIFDCGKKLARTFSYGGGVGIDVSKLAPRGAKLRNAANETTGAVSFMDLYSLITELISQSGRRGALMISIECNHPDLLEFIDLKSDLNKVTKANISIKITDDFMKAVKNNEEFKLQFTRKETGEVIEKIIDAKDIFEKIAYMNWDYAEPGMLFWDNIKNWNLLSKDKNFKYEGVNPCGEEPLPAGGSCLLGSINLSEHIVNPFTGNAYFDHSGFLSTVTNAINYLNEILDEGLELHPLSDQRESVRDWRQVGLGIMGISEMLIKLNIKYGSEESILLCDQIGSAMINHALKASALLAKKHGAYPNFNLDAILESDFFKYNATDEIIDLVKKYGLINSQLLTIAPTGSISTMLGISGGIEPIFELSYIRKTESLHGEDKYYTVYSPILEEFIKFTNCNENDLPDIFVTAMNLNYIDRIKMQAVWQKHIDASISSTVNVPNDFTIDEVKNLYLYAWENYLKGITIYRNGCKREGILTTPTENKSTNNIDSTEIQLPRGFIEQVPECLDYRKYKLKTGCGNLYLFVGVDSSKNKIYDCFTNTDGVGGCMINTIANSRLLSAGLRGGIPIEYLTQQLEKSGSCASYQNIKGRQLGAIKIKSIVSNYIPDDVLKTIDDAIGKPLSLGKSCSSAIANVLNNIIKEFKGIHSNEKLNYELVSILKNDSKFEVKESNDFSECLHPNLRKVEGCSICPDCGYSKCS